MIVTRVRSNSELRDYVEFVQDALLIEVDSKVDGDFVEKLNDFLESPQFHPQSMILFMDSVMENKTQM